MSGKIKSKDLSYDSSLPPFLQRLKDKNAGNGDQDRHERQIARPTKAKDPNDDDGPTVVDESGETLSKEEYENMTKLADDALEGSNVTGPSNPDAEPLASGALPIETAKPEASHGDQRTTDGITHKKRKVAKVIGDGEANEENTTAKQVTKKAKKKTKPVKLAFDDADGS